jgi:hypothetical protein
MTPLAPLRDPVFSALTTRTDVAHDRVTRTAHFVGERIVEKSWVLVLRVYLKSFDALARET